METLSSKRLTEMRREVFCWEVLPIGVGGLPAPALCLWCYRGNAADICRARVLQTKLWKPSQRKYSYTAFPLWDRALTNRVKPLCSHCFLPFQP